MSATKRQIGRCGNCDGWVWSDQQYVNWGGFVPIHSECFDGGSPDRDSTGIDQ